MAPFLIPAIVELAKAIPKLGGLFATSEVAQRNVKAAEVVMSAVVPAVQAANAQEAVEKISADPDARAAAEKAVQEVWWQISEAGGGGIDGARKFLTANSDSSGGMVWRIVAVVTYAALGFLLLANIVAASVYVVAMFRASEGQLTAAMQLLGTVIQADIGAALMACGFWLGSSWGSKQKPAQQP